MHKKGSFLIAIGLLLLAAALLLTLYNVWDAHRADVAAQTAVQALKDMIPTLRTADTQDSQPSSPEESNPWEAAGDGTSEATGNQFPEATEEVFLEGAEDAPWEESEGLPQKKTAGELWKKSDRIRPENAEETSEAETGETSDEEADGENLKAGQKKVTQSTILAAVLQERAMPTMTLHGYQYIGVLDVDSLNLSLPVMDRWDYERLKISPCLFSGNVYQDNLVICGHNYASHFSPLKYVPIGTEIRFTDTEGTVFRYVVSSFETIGPNDVEGMVNGDWDLTLFTCNTSGQTRCAIRCDRIQ